MIDPRAEALAGLAAIADPHLRARAFLARTDIFGELPQRDRIQREVGDALAELARDNVVDVIERRLFRTEIGRAA
ncbi:hypothetical protein [Nocardia crassostreae]|uniref:hypothetical protein n=1 Tax=Nocardia crassostreae TaxID=53428 RepID=UPI00082CC133|nr:hypothetical protein [Nocardia crassostreae]